MRFRCLVRNTSVPHWLTLLCGVMLGGVLTSTFTFHLWWCGNQVSLSTLSLDRQTLSIIRVDEHIRAHTTGGGGGAEGGGGMREERREGGRGDCVCGKALRRLQMLAGQPTHVPPVDGREDDRDEVARNVLEPTYKASPLVTKPSIPTFSPLWGSVSGTANYTQYLNPPDMRDTQQKAKKVQFLDEEYSLRQGLLVAVSVPDDQLAWASQIYDTWGQELQKILFFIGENSNTSEPEAMGLPIVRLVAGPGRSSKDGVLRFFSTLTFLYKHFLETYDWFLLANTQTFIRGAKLQLVLSRLDPSAKVYLGWAAKGRPEDSTTLQLLPHEQYCLGTPGVVLSRGALRELGKELPFCLQALEMRNKGVNEEWSNYDVELGRCMSRRVGVQCSQSAEAKAYFFHDFTMEQTLTSKTLNFPPFSDLVTYYPIPSPSAHLFLHFHYKKKDFVSTLEQARYHEEKINFICNSLVEEEDECHVYVCPCEESATLPGAAFSSKCPAADTVLTVPKSYSPVSKYDIPTWEFFDSTALYNDATTVPGYWLTVCKDRKHEIQVMLSHALQVARTHTGHRLLKFRKVINGYIRHNPSRGNEYIVDAEYTEGRTVIHARTNLVRPIAKNFVTLEDNPDGAAPINFIVPISNVSERFHEFMGMYEMCCLKRDLKLHLWLVVYSSQDKVFVTGLIESYLKTYKRAQITVVEGSGVFSRGRALHLGMSQLRSEDLAFHCDVDMTVSNSFLNRCRKNTIRGKKVYYPEFFKLYNLDYVYIGRPRPKKIPLKRQHGHWAAYSFGMLCIYKSDYDRVGGMDTSIIGWGEEDVRFFERILKWKTLEVFRAPDPGLTHRWHEKVCPPSLSKDQMKHCLSSRGENLADRIQLANYLYEHGYQIKYPQSKDGKG